MVSRILTVAVVAMLLLPLQPVAADGVAFLDLHVEGDVPSGLERNSFFSSSDARFSVVREGDYLLIDVNSQNPQRTSWQLSFLLPGENRVAATVLSSVAADLNTPGNPGNDRVLCDSVALFNQAGSVSSDPSPDVGWSYLHELAESHGRVESLAFSFELACGANAGTIVRGAMGFDRSPATMTVGLPARDVELGAAIPRENSVKEVSVTRSLARAEPVQRPHSHDKPVEHVWVSSGQLVELRFGYDPKKESTISESDSHGAIKVVALTKLPADATMLDNLGGGQSMFWVPTARDIGTNEFEFQTFDPEEAAYLGNARVVVEVLPGDIDTMSLNALPDIQFDRSNLVNGIARVSIGETMEMLVYAKDRNGEAPVLNLKDVPSGARATEVSGGKGRIVWTPTEADRGYSNITVVAVDAEDEQRFSQKTLNVEVLASGFKRPVRINPFAVKETTDQDVASAEE